MTEVELVSGHLGGMQATKLDPVQLQSDRTGSVNRVPHWLKACLMGLAGQ